MAIIRVVWSQHSRVYGVDHVLRPSRSEHGPMQRDYIVKIHHVTTLILYPQIIGVVFFTFWLVSEIIASTWKIQRYTCLCKHVYINKWYFIRIVQSLSQYRHRIAYISIARSNYRTASEQSRILKRPVKEIIPPLSLSTAICLLSNSWSMCQHLYVKLNLTDDDTKITSNSSLKKTSPCRKIRLLVLQTF